MNTIVIARFNEDLNWLSNCIASWVYKGQQVQIEIINKGGLHFGSGLNAREPGTVRLNQIDLPNTGREGSSFLHYLAVNRSGKVMFLQGRIWDHVKPEEVFNINSSNFLPDYLIGLMDKCTGYTQLNGHLDCNLVGEPHHPGLPLLDGWQRVQFIAKINGIILPELPDPIDFNPGACMILNLDAIGHHPKFWGDLNKWLLGDEVRGYLLERYWRLIFEALLN